jgi:hypothetical protein
MGLLGLGLNIFGVLHGLGLLKPSMSPLLCLDVPNAFSYNLYESCIVISMLHDFHAFAHAINRYKQFLFLVLRQNYVVVQNIFNQRWWIMTDILFRPDNCLDV